MRFESVKAHAFGPFRDEQLRFEPGMNVIYGPNEAGKSTWHSALFAGLCGQRRGRGRQQKSDRDFQERHEPWDDSSTWDVGAVVALDRGIRVSYATISPEARLPWRVMLLSPGATMRTVSCTRVLPTDPAGWG